MNYANIVKNPNPDVYSGGYKNVMLFARRDDFLVLQKPTAAGLVLGDAVAIDTSHTFTTPDGFISWDAKQASVTIKGTTTGEDGAAQLEWSGEIIVLGDSASTQEQMRNILNDDVICLVKESACLITDAYIQLGDECVSPVFKVEFDGKTTKEGMKEYKVTITCKKKFFYTGVVTMAAEV